MNLHEDLENELAKTLQKEIDAEIMRGLLQECGWNEVVIRWIMTHEVSREVDDWIKNNVKGGVWNHGLVWMFKESKEANWFALRWS